MRTKSYRRRFQKGVLSEDDIPRLEMWGRSFAKKVAKQLNCSIEGSEVKMDKTKITYYIRISSQDDDIEFPPELNKGVKWAQLAKRLNEMRRDKGNQEKVRKAKKNGDLPTEVIVENGEMSTLNGDEVPYMNGVSHEEEEDEDLSEEEKEEEMLSSPSNPQAPSVEIPALTPEELNQILIEARQSVKDEITSGEYQPGLNLSLVNIGLLAVGIGIAGFSVMRMMAH